jgi:hypothetical protein
MLTEKRTGVRTADEAMTKVFLLFVVVALCGCDTDTSDRIGTIIKVTEAGFLNQKWEIEIVAGGRPGMVEDIASDRLCVTFQDPDLLPSVQQYFVSRQEVLVRFTGTSLDAWANGRDAEACGHLTTIQPHASGNLATLETEWGLGN